MAKFGLGYVEPMTFLALRFACVVVIMVVLFLILWPPLPRTPLEWGHLAIVGFLLQAMYFGMCYMSFTAGLSVGTLALILAMQPILGGLIAPRCSGETVSWQQWAGLVLGLSGAVLVITARSEIAAPSPVGFLFASLALVGIKGGSLWEKRFGVSHHPVTTNLVGFTAGLAGVFLFMVAFEAMQITWTWQLIGSFVYWFIASSLIAIGLLLAMIRAGEVSKVSVLFFLVPPVAAAVAWVILGEVMATSRLGGDGAGRIGCVPRVKQGEGDVLTAHRPQATIIDDFVHTKRYPSIAVCAARPISKETHKRIQRETPCVCKVII